MYKCILLLHLHKKKRFNKKHFSNAENIQHIEQSLYGITHSAVEAKCYQWCYRVVLQTEV